MTEFLDVPDNFICNCQHHQRCHVDSGGQCDHRSCGCLIFDPDRNATVIAAVRFMPEAPQPQLKAIPETDRWLERKDLE